MKRRDNAQGANGMKTTYRTRAVHAWSVLHALCVLPITNVSSPEAFLGGYAEKDLESASKIFVLI